MCLKGIVRMRMRRMKEESGEKERRRQSERGEKEYKEERRSGGKTRPTRGAFYTNEASKQREDDREGSVCVCVCALKDGQMNERTTKTTTDRPTNEQAKQGREGRSTPEQRRAVTCRRAFRVVPRVDKGCLFLTVHRVCASVSAWVPYGFISEKGGESNWTGWTRGQPASPTLFSFSPSLFALSPQTFFLLFVQSPVQPCPPPFLLVLVAMEKTGTDQNESTFSDWVFLLMIMTPDCLPVCLSCLRACPAA